jgi:hypothetical protein
MLKQKVEEMTTLAPLSQYILENLREKGTCWQMLALQHIKKNSKHKR